MDYSLVLVKVSRVDVKKNRLNPCCNGLQSSTITVDIETLTQYSVLILVVMDYSLVQITVKGGGALALVLILVVMDYSLVQKP